MACSPSVELPTLSSMPSSAVLDDESAPGVHFDDTCVLIPDPVVQSRMPRLIKKSYSLPLWRRRSNSNPPSAELEGQLSSSPEDKPGVSITVPVPSFAKSRSPTRGEHVHQPLVSCLVTSPTTSPRRHVRRPSLPLPIRPDAVTVPLRDCCRECYPITEECLKEGTVWEEKFTRAARRRRNSSAADHAHAHTQRHRRVCDDVPGFAAIVSVDEVEKRHSITSAPDALTSEDEPDAGLLPSFSRRLKLADTPAVPIAEEAEDELFPLPSPSASSSHLPASAHGDDLSPLPQGARDSSPSPVPSPRPRLAQPDDQEDQRSRSSAYFTPDASPALPSLEEPRSQSSGSSDSSGPASPETPFTPPPRSVSIPAAVRQPSYYSETSSFEFVQTPPSEAMHGSPEMLSTSPSGKKRQFIHMPNLPTPGSFFRAGAEMFKGVSVMGSGSPMALSV